MRPRHWLVLDFITGAFFALIAFAATLQPTPGIGRVSVALAFRLLLALVVLVPVGLRRRRPVVAYGALLVVAALTIGIWQASAIIVMVAAASVLYTLAVTSARRTSAVALAIGLVTTPLMAVFWQHSPPHNGGAFLSAAFALVICWMVGYATRQRRLYSDMLREQATSSAVAEERLRIARELHDVVAHSMSVIAVQAGFGQYVIDSSPSDAREALGAIQATSRDALEEMRRMLGVLRQQDTAGRGSAATATSASATGTPADGPAPGSAPAPGDPGAALIPPAGQVSRAPLAPEPGIDDLDRLIERTSCTGVRVSLQRFGTPRSLPAGVGLSAYRIIQEALTNVVKHAGSDARCVVCVRFGDEAIDIQVTDDGGLSASGAPSSGPPPAHADVATMGSGHGITGMRERVHLCGGEFSAGPLPEGGFEVAATLPLHPALADLGRRA
jgi:signal transduction histidine kinase